MVLMIQPHDHDDRDSGGPADCSGNCLLEQVGRIDD